MKRKKHIVLYDQFTHAAQLFAIHWDMRKLIRQLEIVRASCAPTQHVFSTVSILSEKIHAKHTLSIAEWMVHETFRSNSAHARQTFTGKSMLYVASVDPSDTFTFWRGRFTNSNFCPSLVQTRFCCVSFTNTTLKRVWSETRHSATMQSTRWMKSVRRQDATRPSENPFP